MAATLGELLEENLRKMQTLGEEIQTLRETAEKLREENISLQAKVAELTGDLEKSRRDVEFLTVSHRLADNPDSLAETRRHVARLIRNIDRCIAMLKE